MKNRWTIIAVLIAIVLALSNMPSTFAQTPVGNRVTAQLSHSYSYFTFEDSIDNDPLIWDHDWAINLINRPDGGPSVQNPKVELRTDLKLVRFVPDDPSVFTAQPSLGLYIWNFSGVEIEEPAMLPLCASSEDPFIARPRFTLSRIVEPETLADNTTFQTVTVSFRLEELLPPDVDWLMISIGNPVIAYQGYRLVEGYFVSQISLASWNEGTDGVQAWWDTNPLNLEVGTTYIFQATLKSVKSPDLLGSPIFKPEVMILYGKWINEPDIITGNSVTITHPTKSISATFMADNVVDWDMALSEPFFNLHLWPVVSQITPPPPPFHVLIPADVTIKPETLNTNSNGQFTAFVQLPQQYDITEIDISTVTCEGALAIKGTIDQGVLILKFHRQDLNAIESGEGVEFTVTGELEDGSIFEGTDTIRVK